MKRGGEPTRTLALLGWDEDDIQPCLERLAVADYCRGPEPDEGGFPGHVYQFGVTQSGVMIYVKVRLPPTGGPVCISFHETTQSMRFPHGPTGRR